MWSAEIASICLCHKTVPSKGSWLSWHQQGQILLRCHFLFSSVLPDNAQALTSKGHIQCAYSKCIFKCLQIIANVSLYFHAFKCLFHPQQTERMGYYLCCHDDSGKLSVKYSVKNSMNLFSFVTISSFRNRSANNVHSFKRPKQKTIGKFARWGKVNN